jgi:AcrR family transcriptional regulator
MEGGMKIIMEKFFNLPEEKKNMILDAALTTFAGNGYKKTSVSDIAAAAGISKSMVFHYFGTKKELYLYLVNYCGNIIITEVKDKFDMNIKDFFERIKLASLIEFNASKKHSAILAFLGSAYTEDNEEVKADLKVIFSQGEGFRSELIYKGTDTSRFKDNIDLTLVIKMLGWIADGFVNNLKDKSIDIDTFCDDFFRCLDLLRDNFYKQE